VYIQTVAGVGYTFCRQGDQAWTVNAIASSTA
jgi:hypothetical protein